MYRRGKLHAPADMPNAKLSLGWCGARWCFRIAFGWNVRSMFGELSAADPAAV